MRSLRISTLALGMLIAMLWGWEAERGVRGFVSIYLAPLGIGLLLINVISQLVAQYRVHKSTGRE